MRYGVGRAANLLALLCRQCGERILATLQRDERLRDRRVELCADVALDLRQGLVGAEAGAVGPVAGHRVEAVGDDEELRCERLIGRRDSVVAAAVVALAVVLDRSGLGGRDLEPAQQASREAGRSPDGAPLVRPELAGLAQDSRVDRDLAEVVQRARPSAGGRCRSRGARARGRASRRSRPRGSSGDRSRGRARRRCSRTSRAHGASPGVSAARARGPG